MLADLFSPEQLTILTQIILIDLILAGDNAIIIGMVASKFPTEQRKKIIFWGIGGAIALRIILTSSIFFSSISFLIFNILSVTLLIIIIFTLSKRDLDNIFSKIIFVFSKIIFF